MTPFERRLAADVEELGSGYFLHPTVRVGLTGDTAASGFTVTYKVLTAGLDPDDEQPVVIEAPPVTISLPEGYPRLAPEVRVAAAVLHPNVAESDGAIDLGIEWAPSRSLREVVAAVGERLQFASYDLATPANLLAARWAQANPEIFPLGTVDVSPNPKTGK